MKIAFPTMNDKGLESTLADHFGRAPYFTVYNKATKEVDVLANSGNHFGGSISTPEVLKQGSVDILVCKGLGRKAVALLEEAKIGIYITDKPIVKEAVEAYLADKLKQASEEEACAGSHDH